MMGEESQATEGGGRGGGGSQRSVVRGRPSEHEEGDLSRGAGSGDDDDDREEAWASEVKRRRKSGLADNDEFEVMSAQPEEIGETSDQFWQRLEEEVRGVDDALEEPVRGKAVWRETILGMALVMALDELAEEEKILPEQTVEVMEIFEDVITKTLPSATSKAAAFVMSGRMKTYKNFLGTWTIITDNFRLFDTKVMGRRRHVITSKGVRIMAAERSELSSNVPAKKLRKVKALKEEKR